MSHTPHELDDEFPDHVERLNALKAESAHFRGLAETYHELNRAIHRAETDIEPLSETELEDMKKRRLALLDEIAAMLKA